MNNQNQDVAIRNGEYNTKYNDTIILKNIETAKALGAEEHPVVKLEVLIK